MAKEVTVKEALNMKGAKLIDVRSESEFSEATIPGSINIPLLRDSERAAVGAVYKQMGVNDARLLGLEYVTPRLPQMVKEYQELAVGGNLIVFCWRGGMRSKSVCSVLESMGLPVYRLVGGYKAYRRYVNEYLERELPHKVVVFHGLTGIGKTEILQELRKMSIPAVDLEGLANNRGSVFGQIGMKPQPSQKMFDGLLVRELAFWEPAGYIIVECESRRIGRIILPALLVESMRSGVKILGYCSIEKRKDRIKRIYAGSWDKNRLKLKEAIKSLEQRVGKKRTADFCEMVDKGNLDEIVEYLLIKYYDPLYSYPSGPDPEYDLSVNTDDIKKAAIQIRDFLNEKFGAKNLV